MKPILDPACGSRMFYFDKAHPDVLFGDARRNLMILCDGRTLEIRPDVGLDFRALPFPNESFHLVIFDPPHLLNAGPKSLMAKKYGKLSENWESDLRAGFRECFRVLRPNGTLIFKWNEIQIPVSRIIHLCDVRPVIGNRRPKRTGTHWLVFFKGDGNDKNRMDGQSVESCHGMLENQRGLQELLCET
jgi:SAM-dependent methyltransferase